MKKIQKILVNDEELFIKKDWLGWRVVNPILKNPEEGWSMKNINWFNLLVGGKRGLVFLLFIIILITLFYLGINQLTEQCRIVTDDPCKFCYGVLY